MNTSGNTFRRAAYAISKIFRSPDPGTHKLGRNLYLRTAGIVRSQGWAARDQPQSRVATIFFERVAGQGKSRTRKSPRTLFLWQLRSLGIANAPLFSEMAGVTFQDVIVHVEPLTRSLLFHELVHCVQYTHLGLEGFAEHYVRGFLDGGLHEEIPLEKQAYELEARFNADPDARFSVEADVLRRLKLKQL
jgi:hypothetical protein